MFKMVDRMGRYMNIILLGQITSGKGTLAEGLREEFGFELVSIGALLREETKKDTPEAKTIAEYQEKGNLVPEEIVIAVLKKHMANAASKNLLFDGYPRNLQQAKTLDSITDIDAVLVLDVENSIVRHRFMGRRGCKKCGHITHVDFIGDKQVCPVCGGELEIRNDMTEEAMINKMKSFETETKPLIDYYSNWGIIHHLDAGHSPEHTLEQAVEVLKGLK